jgi:hypothetical protein
LDDGAERALAALASNFERLAASTIRLRRWRAPLICLLCRKCRTCCAREWNASATDGSRTLALLPGAVLRVSASLTIEQMNERLQAAN